VTPNSPERSVIVKLSRPDSSCVSICDWPYSLCIVTA
jgi:hypothetical protein